MTSGHEKIVRNIMMTTALINVFLNIQLVQVFGIEGVAISTMVSVAIWNIWMLLSVKKYLGFWTFYNSY
jgi:O-antigen/teichoic acid export membrane protein